MTKAEGSAVDLTAGLVGWCGRAWDATVAQDRVRRARLPLDQRVALAAALHEAARATRPGWPTDADRRGDLAAHEALAALLRRAGEVGGH